MSINAWQLSELDDIQLQDSSFRVDSLASATWAIRKLMALQAKEIEVKAVAETEKANIQSWEDAELAKLLPHQEFFTNLLTDFHRRMLEQDPKAKTITTPHGALKSVTRKPAPKNEDDDKLLAYLKEAGFTEHIKVVEKPQWGEFKKTLSIVQEGEEWFVVDQSGFPVPGVTVDLGGTTFKVEVSQ